MSNIKIIKEATDPVCTRVSIGGKEEFGYYGVYRGSLGDAINCTKLVLAEMEKEQFLLDIEKDRHDYDAFKYLKP